MSQQYFNDLQPLSIRAAFEAHRVQVEDEYYKVFCAVNGKLQEYPDETYKQTLIRAGEANNIRLNGRW
jgi:hypothetical protein